MFIDLLKALGFRFLGLTLSFARFEVEIVKKGNRLEIKKEQKRFLGAGDREDDNLVVLLSFLTATDRKCPLHTSDADLKKLL